MKTRLSRVRQPQKFDFILVAIIILLFITSLLSIYAALPHVSASVPKFGLNGILTKQIIFYFLSFGIVGIIMYVGNDNIFDLAKLGYYIFLGLLVYLLISKFAVGFGILSRDLPLVHTANGATSWLNLGFMQLQPSEFIKVCLVVITAKIIALHNEDKLEDSFENDIQLFLKLLKWYVAPLALIVVQPDTGIFFIIGMILIIMLIFSGIRNEWIIFGFLAVLLLVIGFFYIFIYQRELFDKIFSSNNEYGYKAGRIYGWLTPEQTVSGVGYQLYSSLLSIGSSGIWGSGIHLGYVAILEPHTDFIFAIIASSYGLVGAIGVLVVIFALDFRLYQISSRAKTQFEKLIIIGFLAMLIIQQIVNMAMVIGLLPITGITLPFISYGGSSILSFMLAIGIIMNISLKSKKLSDYVY